MGALLAAALLGPWAAALTMTVVLLAQALVMADGGITALGANVTNMAVVAVFAGYGLFLLLKRLLPRTPTGYLVSIGGGFLVLRGRRLGRLRGRTGALGHRPARKRAAGHGLGAHDHRLGEALITAAVLSAVLVARPDLVASFDLPRESLRPAGATRLSGAVAHLVVRRRRAGGGGRAGRVRLALRLELA